MQAWDTPQHYNELLKLIPYKRIGEPEEIGRGAVWLASDESDYIQGTTLFVDGGMTLYPDVCCRNFRDTAVFDNVPRGNEDILAYVETRSDARRAVVVFDHNVRDTGNRKGSEGVSP
ncbi:MAG: hypothetical protein DMF08_08725 [Verrucomicrobia bacterium]|nr:MAG: hypothetical protein DMF08_08725 [Verrucomicrobiota bacterium]